MSELDKIFNDFNKKAKTEIATTGYHTIKTDKIPFSSPRVNYMTYGGLPRGFMFEFAGEESSGKSTTALDIVGNAQKIFYREWLETCEELEKSSKKSDIEELQRLKKVGEEVVIYADTEHTYDETWAEKNGVDNSKLRILHPFFDTAEALFQRVIDILDGAGKEVGMIVVDSIGDLVSQQIYDEDLSKKAYGGISAPLTMFSNKVVGRLKYYKVLLLVINQVREDFDNPYNKYKTTGGRGFKHMCGARLIFQKGKYIDDAGIELKNNQVDRFDGKDIKAAGNKVNISIAKTKVFKPDRKVGFYTLRYDIGVDILADTVDLGIKEKIIIQSGSYFKFLDPDTKELIQDDDGKDINIQGKINAMNWVDDNKKYYAKIYEYLKIKCLEE